MTSARIHAGEADARDRTRGFTLLEVMLAVSILALAAAVTAMTFTVVIGGWRRSAAMTDTLQRGDFVMDQLIMALRSAYYPDSRRPDALYGFQHEDSAQRGGDSDVISWVKLGTALIGEDQPFVGSPHRVMFSVREDEHGRPAAAVTAWQVFGQMDDFDPDDLPPIFLSDRIVGFNCRAAYRMVDDEIEWHDQWEYTNQLPTAVELTLYIQPPDKNDPPMEIKRVLGIPVAPLSWR